MAGKAAGAAKAAGTVAIGGGPEDPVTDAIAIGQLTGSAGTPKKKGAPADSGGGEDTKAPAKSTPEKPSKPAADKPAKSAPGGPAKPGRKGRALGWAWSDNRRLLTAEFVACVAVLFLGTLVSPPDSKHDVERAMIKGSALAGTFFLLALVSSGGKTPARVANAIGTLITATYVLTSADVHNIVEWVAGFFSPESAGEKVGASIGGDGSNGQPAGGSSVLGVTA